MRKNSINCPSRSLFKVAKRMCVLAKAVLLLLACKSSFSAELVIGVEDLDYAPYYYHDGGQYRGFSRELLDAYATKYGHTIRFQSLPITRLYYALLKGQIDMKFPDSPLWARDIKKSNKIYYSKEIVEYVDGVMVLSDRLGQSLEDLVNLSTVRGFTPWDFIAQVNAGTIQVLEYNDLNGVIHAVLQERADGCYFNVSVANHYIKKAFGEDKLIIFDQDLPHTKDYYHLSTIKHTEILKEFDQFLIDERDFVVALKQKYSIRI